MKSSTAVVQSEIVDDELGRLQPLCVALAAATNKRGVATCRLVAIALQRLRVLKADEYPGTPNATKVSEMLGRAVDLRLAEREFGHKSDVSKVWGSWVFRLSDAGKRLAMGVDAFQEWRTAERVGEMMSAHLGDREARWCSCGHAEAGHINGSTTFPECAVPGCGCKMFRARSVGPFGSGDPAEPVD